MYKFYITWCRRVVDHGGSVYLAIRLNVDEYFFFNLNTLMDMFHLAILIISN
ncbi:hypothetical protein RhiirA1_532127 [Rhizophagus irregularis]|uniref:Uncharacterized protein n=1 Tax=Rhizophagus irregularis TaxID=588596 RepID=A0A2N0S6Q1_9GLOM|nr:hypothetical protein RhiirA1_532127 [Rhizophagus irregularis]